MGSLDSLSGQWRETFDAARGSPGLVAFGTRSVVKLDGLDWLDGLVRRGVDGRDCNVCVCCLVKRTAMYSSRTRRRSTFFLTVAATLPLAASLSLTPGRACLGWNLRLIATNS
jgi:hypothetical protein